MIRINGKWKFTEKEKKALKITMNIPSVKKLQSDRVKEVMNISAVKENWLIKLKEAMKRPEVIENMKKSQTLERKEKVRKKCKTYWINLSFNKKEEIRINKSGDKNSMWGKFLSEEAIKKIKEAMQNEDVKKKLIWTPERREIDKKYWTLEKRERKRELRSKQIFPMQDTTIEIIIQNFLKQLGIEFLTHQYIKNINHRFQCDIFIPVQEGIIQKTIIECDGDYWHGNTKIYSKFNDWQLKQIAEDKIRNKELIERGFKVIRIWENEIRILSIEDFKNKLEEVKQ